MFGTNQTKWYTVKEVAAYFQVEEFTVRRWINKGVLPARRKNLRAYVVSEEDLKKFDKQLQNLK